jgi:hypothetical protein
MPGKGKITWKVDARKKQFSAILPPGTVSKELSRSAFWQKARQLASSTIFLMNSAQNKKHFFQT